jgi:hypothetical protein
MDVRSRRSWTRLFALLAIGVGFFTSAHAQVRVSAALSNPSPSVGEPVQLQLRCEGTNRAGQPPPVEVDGLDIRYLGPSTQMQIINGAMSASVTHVYQVIPMRAGTFTIPAIEMEIDGRRLRTAPVGLTAAAGNPGAAPGGSAPPMDKIGFAEITLPKQAAYVGEALPAEVRLFIDARVQSQIETIPQLQGEGFTKTKLTEPRREQARRDGRDYNVVTFRTALTPSKAGKIAIGPADFSFLAQVPRAQRNRQRSVFDMFDDVFNGSPFAATQRMSARAEAVELDVKPLPVQGRPADFSGAVGEFRFAAEGSPREVKVGDPVTMRLRVSGRGNFDRVAPPALTDATGWRSYPPSGNFTAEDELNLSGVKTFEMAVIPEAAKTAMPQFAFSYFDPTAEKYVTLTSEPAPLTVQGAPPPPPPPVPQASSAASPEPTEPPPAPPADDILGLHYELGATGESFAPLYARRGFLLAQLVPLAVLLVLGARRFLYRGEDERARKAMVREKESLLARLRGESSHAEFFDTAARVIQIETALGTGRLPGSVDASAACASRRLDAETAEAVAEIFNARAELLYAGGGAGDGRISATERDRVLATISKFSGANGKA